MVKYMEKFTEIELYTYSYVINPKHQMIE